MKIAYITSGRPINIFTYSGTTYYIYHNLEKSGFDMQNICVERSKFFILFRLKKFFLKMFKKKYIAFFEPKKLKYFTRQLNKKIKDSKPDVFFVTHPRIISYLKTDVPIVFWSDSPFAGLIDYYPKFTNLPKSVIKTAHKVEQQSLTNSRLLIFSSDWAAQNALNNYDINPDRVKVVPYGANIDNELTEDEVKQVIDKRDKSKCKLIFNAKEWERKGGNKAIYVAKLLKDRGIDVELNIVGIDLNFPTPDFVNVYGFIKKDTQKGQTLINDLYKKSHFLILPTLADCVPVVLAESCSYGVPCLTTDTGGISTVIRNGVNGQMFSLESGAEEYCDYIIRLMDSQKEYKELAFSSFLEYKKRLNWSTNINKVKELIEEYC